MQSENKNHISDITFIGSGISSSFTILHFLDSIENHKSTNKNIRITIIDKYSEFHTGIPYGSRSGFSVHLITSLKNFLPEPELSKFISWLNTNKDWLLDELKNDGGALATDWLNIHADKIANNDWEDLFIPRRFFGCYIDEKVKHKVQEFENLGIVTLKYIQAEVFDIEKREDKYELFLKNNNSLLSHKVVLSVGSLPVNHLWKKEDIVTEENLLFVNTPYKPELKEVLNKIENFTDQLSGKKINVLIVGANASGLEMIYKLNDVDHLQNRVNKFMFLSTQGLLPDSVIDEELRKEYTPHNLQALTSEKELTAQIIADAAYKDLDHADEIELGAASTVEIVSKAFGSLLSKLNEEELRKFACLHGNEIGRRQRCAGFHYSKTIHALKQEDRFDHIAGRFNDIKKNDEGDYFLEYLDTASQKNITYDTPIHLVINCIGSTNLSKNDIPDLLKNVIQKGYARPNDSKIGFEVNESLETCENLHVVGPLLAGNVFEGKAVWHLEHCGRIIWLSHVLSERFNTYFFEENKLKERS